jgi:hypothetical protein
MLHFMKTLMIACWMVLVAFHTKSEDHLHFPRIFWSDGATWYMPVWEVEKYDEWTDEAMYHYDIEFDEYVLL